MKIIAFIVILLMMGCEIVEPSPTLMGKWQNDNRELDFNDGVLIVTYQAFRDDYVYVYSFALDDSDIYRDDILWTEVKELTNDSLTLYFYDLGDTVVFVKK